MNLARPLLAGAPLPGAIPVHVTHNVAAQPHMWWGFVPLRTSGTMAMILLPQGHRCLADTVRDLVEWVPDDFGEAEVRCLL